MCRATKTNYGNWFNNGFKELNQRIDEFRKEYRAEAIKLLRENTQLEAALLEESIIIKLKEELEYGEYSLMKTHLGREVYTRLLTDLEAQMPAPQTVFNWNQRINAIKQFMGGETQDGFIEGESTFSETDPSKTEEHQESHLLQTHNGQVKEEAVQGSLA